MTTALKRLFRLFEPKAGIFLAAYLVLTVIAGLAEMVGVGIIVSFVSLINDTGDWSSNVFLRVLSAITGSEEPRIMVAAGAALIVGFSLLKNGYIAAVNYFNYRFLARQQSSLAQRLFAAYMRGAYHHHLTRNSADLLRNTNEEAINLHIEYVLPFMTIVAEGVIVAMLIGLMLHMEPVVTLIAAGVLSASCVAVYGFFRLSTKRLGARRLAHLGQLNQTVMEGLGGFKELRVLGREERAVDAFGGHARNYAATDAASEFMRQMPRYINEPLLMCGLLAITATLLLQGRSHIELIAPLTLFAAAGLRLLPSVNRIMSNIHALNYRDAAVDTVLEDLAVFTAEGVTDRPATRRAAEETGPAAIRFDRVSCHYPDSRAASVKAVDLTIPRGAAVAFVGRSGSGKTTLIDLLLGLLEPSEGRITIDGQDLAQCRDRLRAQVGFIPQTIFLADASIRSNVAFGLPPDQIDHSKVTEAIRLAQLDEFVGTLPDGLDTLIGERGVRLSGGQRQRIGIARALYDNPSILIMDEATAALDNQTERELMASIERLAGEKTLIYVAHRLSTIEHCDRIFVLSHGALVAEGTFEELIATSDEFRHLARGSKVSRLPTDRAAMPWRARA